MRMLPITIPATELWDESKEEFIRVKEQTLQLEHSLVSISKWESKWHKPFLNKSDKSLEETLDYIQCMTLTQNVRPEVYKCLTQENVKQINDYISNPMTASFILDEVKSKNNREQITSELIYYWMIALEIPFECQKWHLNRLLMLIRICNVKNQPPKKQSRKDITSQYAAINAARRKALNSKG